MAVVQWKRFVALIAAGVFTALMFAQLYRAEIHANGAHSAVVFETIKGKLLTDDNLVDALDASFVNNRLIRVRWDNSMLIVDLSVDTSHQIWQDTAELLRLAFADKTNVRQVLIRMFDSKQIDRRLLLAMETRKLEWADDELAEALSEPPRIGQDYASKLRMTWTQAGGKWRDFFAN